MNGNRQHGLHEASSVGRKAAERRKSAKADRDGTQFLALPAKVTNSPGWLAASHTARSLIISMATAPTRKGHMPFNGHLQASMARLNPAWKSEGTVRKAVKELLECGLLHQTRLHAFPNTPALYALTWLALGPVEGLDPSMVRAFRRGAYESPTKPIDRGGATRVAAASKALGAKRLAQEAGYTLAPFNGGLNTPRAPSQGGLSTSSTPSDGCTLRKEPSAKAPSDGENLEYRHLHEHGAGHKQERTSMGRLLARRTASSPHRTSDAAMTIAALAGRRPG